MKNLFKKARILSMVILVLAFLGCEDDDEGTTLPAVTAGFTFDLIPNTGSVSFINVSENANTFEWDFGNGTTSTEIDPTVTFTSGTYTVALTANNVAGASDTFEDEITISIPEPPALPIDFDGTNVGYDAIVGDNIGFSVVTNPETGNGNTTNVGQMVAGGGQFQNVQFPLGTAVDFSGENKTIQLELFSSTEIAVLVKFEDGDGARDVEVLTTHTGSGWETLNFDFASDAVASFIQNDPQNGQAIVPDGQYGGMVLFIGFSAEPGVEGTFLVDNIVQTTTDGGGMATEPTMAAPAPTQDAANVTSVFSNAYTNADGTNPRAFGNDGGATFSEIQVAGDDVWSYASTNFVGLQNDGGFDGRTNFSMDIWVAEDVSFRAGLISFTDPASREDVEVNLTGGQWNNIDVALADLVPSLGTEGPLPDAPTINQIIFDVLGDGVEANIFVDNVFFYTADGGGMATEPTMAAPAPTQDAANVTSVFSNAYTNADGTNPRAFGNDGGATFSEIQVAGDDVWSYADTNFVGLQNDGGFDGRTNFSMDIWVAEDISFRAGLISFTDPVSREDVEVNLTGGQWNNIDVALADLVPSLGAEGPLPDAPTINQIIFDVLGDGVEANIFVDNVFFYTADGGGMATEPTMAAPAPTQDAANVTSVFSNAYTNAAGTNPRAFGNDGGATFSEIQVAGDDVWSYASTNFVGLQNDGGFDGRTNFSMDIWVAEDVSFRAGLISFTDPVSREDVEVNLTGGQWNNIDVALADLVSSLGAEGPLPDAPTINQIIFDVLGDGVEANIFVDNVFFYTADGGGACPAPPTGELLSNGDFEANSGDGACWQLNQGGGSVTIIDTDADTGTYSARLTTGTSQVPNLKQERFAPTVAGGQNIQVTFRYKVTSSFVDGSILQVLAFSERSVGGAQVHDLGNATGMDTVDVWQDYTGTFTTDAGVDEGLSLLIQATCGGAATCAGEVIIDNVVVTEL